MSLNHDFLDLLDMNPASFFLLLVVRHCGGLSLTKLRDP